MYTHHIARMTLAIILGVICMEAIAEDDEQEQRRTARSRIGEIEQKITAASERARQSVVRIAWGKEEREGGCSGVVIDAEGHVATSGRGRRRKEMPATVPIWESKASAARPW